MECPVCKRFIPKFKEILMIVDKSCYCHHCWSRLLCCSDGEGEVRVEEDLTGQKWRKAKESLSTG